MLNAKCWYKILSVSRQMSCLIIRIKIIYTGIRVETLLARVVVKKRERMYYCVSWKERYNEMNFHVKPETCCWKVVSVFPLAFMVKLGFYRLKSLIFSHFLHSLDGRIWGVISSRLGWKCTNFLITQQALNASQRVDAGAAHDSALISW